MENGKEPLKNLSEDEYLNITRQLAVSVDKYSKPVRIYLDVDGVISPYLKPNSDLSNYHKKEITAYKNNGLSKFSQIAGSFYYNPTVTNKVAAWSKREDVDLVWVSSWLGNAPLILDPLLGIESLGYLPWEQKFSDYNQTFKRVAIWEEQELSPSRFVWIDDLTTATEYFYDDDTPVPIFSEDEYLSNQSGYEWETLRTSLDPETYLTITPNRSIGLTMDEVNQVNAWLG